MQFSTAPEGATWYSSYSTNRFWAKAKEGSGDYGFPFKITTSGGYDFIPNITLDGQTGAAYFGAKKVMFNPDGSGHLANDNISWDMDGNVRFEGAVSSPFIDVTDVTTVEGVELYFHRRSNNLYVNSSTLKTLNIPDSADYNGQIIRIHNVGSSLVQLTADAGASEASIFWLPAGASANMIQLPSGEAVEMICVAIDGAFHSWDVLRIYECRPL